MVDSVGGSPVTTQLRAAQTVALSAIRNEREQAEAVARNIDRTARDTRPPPPPPQEERGQNLDVRI